MNAQRFTLFYKVNAQRFTLLHVAAANGFIFRKKIRLNFRIFDKENTHLFDQELLDLFVNEIETASNQELASAQFVPIDIIHHDMHSWSGDWLCRFLIQSNANSIPKVLESSKWQSSLNDVLFVYSSIFFSFQRMSDRLQNFRAQGA